MAGADLLPQGAGAVALRRRQHRQVAVQACGIAGLQVVVQQHTGGCAIGHTQHPDPGAVQPVDQRGA